ncbi:MAG: hypothetical protein ABI155_10010 [Paralcaligenes sp.]
MLLYLLSLCRRSGHMFFAVAKVMLPVMLGVEIAQRWGLIQVAGHFIAPGMALLNLPPEAGLVWISTVFIGTYGGIATLVAVSSSIHLSLGQLNALCVMILIAHSIPVEQAIVRAAGASFSATAALRLGVALLYGAAVAWLSQLTGLMTEPVSLTWLQGSGSVQVAATGGGYWAWIQSTATTMLMLLAIIFVLALLLDTLERLRITPRITALLSPLLKLSGLDSRVTPVTTVGVLLGLTYGGALIIEAAKKHQLDARARFLALAWLSLSHGLIEDTIVVLALGANVWIVLVGRLAITMLVVALLAKFTYRKLIPGFAP